MYCTVLHMNEGTKYMIFFFRDSLESFIIISDACLGLAWLNSQVTFQGGCEGKIKSKRKD